MKAIVPSLMTFQDRRAALYDALESRILVLDGAMGALLQAQVTLDD